MCKYSAVSTVSILWTLRIVGIDKRQKELYNWMDKKYKYISYF